MATPWKDTREASIPREEDVRGSTSNTERDEGVVNDSKGMSQIT